MKKIYIFLTKTNSMFSRLIHLATSDEYTHSAISLDEDLEELYSFSRLYARMPFPGAFMHENIDAGFYLIEHKCNCTLLELSVTDQEYENVRERLETVKANHKKFKYAYLGVFLSFFKIRYEKARRYFCSQFVSSVIEENTSVNLPKESCFMRPCDLMKIEGVKEVFKGTIEELSEKIKLHKSIIPVRLINA